MEFIRNFTQIDKNDAALAGGKGASLGEMTRADIPVPPGFVILAEAFEKFLEEAHLKAEIEAKLAAVKHEEIHTIENASGQIQALVMAAKMPNDMTSEIHTHFKKLNTPYVAVRSSATAEDSAAAAWAGQLDTFLNTSETELLDNVKKCWASLFTPRAIFYRFEKGLHTTEISVAVVVQKMVESEISGIAFSVHPVTEDYNQMIIEAGLGLGEAIVSGQITPDSYVMEKQPRRIIDTQIATQTRGLYRSESGGNSWLDIAEEIGAKQVLSDEQILELAALILKIENHYGFPVDVEWAFEKGTFYIVQSRPVTTLRKDFAEVYTDNGIITIQDEIRISDYQRLFEIHDLHVYFMISTIWMEHYKKLRALVTYHNNTWTTYLPKKIVKQCLEDGLQLYGNTTLFNLYKKEFSAYIKNYIEELRELTAKKLLTRDDASAALDKASQFFYFYSKTEFFYTDKAFLESENNTNLKNNLIELETIKNSSREAMNQIFFGDKSYFYRFISVLAQQLNIDPATLFCYYKKQEILKLFENKKIEEALQRRREEGYVITSDGQKMTITDGSAATEVLNKIHLQISGAGASPMLGGVSANPGKAKGIAYVIPSDYYHNYEKLNQYLSDMGQGTILVAETTSPELMPACKKALAIITNQGGLLSHAAIVSREMGIPCIVGIGNATEVIKTGDMIEVDAETGTVLIIQK